MVFFQIFPKLNKNLGDFQNLKDFFCRTARHHEFIALLMQHNFLTVESMWPLTMRLPMMSIIVPPTKRDPANPIAFHGIFTGGLMNYNNKHKLSNSKLLILSLSAGCGCYLWIYETNIGFGELCVIHVVELSFPVDTFSPGHAQFVWTIWKFKKRCTL